MNRRCGRTAGSSDPCHVKAEAMLPSTNSKENDVVCQPFGGMTVKFHVGNPFYYPVNSRPLTSHALCMLLKVFSSKLGSCPCPPPQPRLGTRPSSFPGPRCPGYRSYTLSIYSTHTLWAHYFVRRYGRRSTPISLRQSNIAHGLYRIGVKISFPLQFSYFSYRLYCLFVVGKHYDISIVLSLIASLSCLRLIRPYSSRRDMLPQTMFFKVLTGMQQQCSIL